MDRIRFHRLVRAIESEARAHGYQGDIFADANDIPMIGTYSQQMAVATIGCDVSPGAMSTRDRELLGRLVRAAVLTSPPRRPLVRVDNSGKLARERRRVG